MVKLTTDLIDNSRQYINPVADRELDLRGYKIAVIENLGGTYDQFDTIDFCENDIRKLDGFPYLPRLKHLLLCNNRVTRFGENLAENIPNITGLTLTNNNVEELGDLDPLTCLKKLTYLSLIGNPVVHKPSYRLYTIYRLPQLRVLDFKRIRLVDRNCAAAMFKGKKGKALQQKIVKRSKTFVPGGPLPDKKPANGVVPTLQDIRAIKDAITKAASLEEVERLNQMLQSGQVPGRQAKGPPAPSGILSLFGNPPVAGRSAGPFDAAAASPLIGGAAVASPALIGGTPPLIIPGLELDNGVMVGSFHDTPVAGANEDLEMEDEEDEGDVDGAMEEGRPAGGTWEEDEEEEGVDES